MTVEELNNNQGTQEVLEEQENVKTDNQGKDVKESDTKKILEKMQKRIDSKTAKANQAENKLQAVLQELEELKAGKKSVKELSEEEEFKKSQQEKDNRIAELEERIAFGQATRETDEILKKGGLIVGDELLNILVTTDPQQTHDNTKAFLNFIDSQKEQWLKERNTGRTPNRQTANNQPDLLDKLLAERIK